MIGMLRRRSPLGIYSITYDLDNVTKQGTAAKVIGGESFQDTLSTDAVMISVIVKMGGRDITSSAYNPTTKAISIPFVNGNIVITAIASPVIVFTDQNVKSLCVTNWGGNYLAGEITEYEAAQVTSLNEVFKGNTQITSFDELRFFTGLTSLYNAFYDCTSLTSVVIPKANITNIAGAFRMTRLSSLDLSPLTPCVISDTSMLLQRSTTSGTLTYLKLAGGSYVNFNAALSRNIGLTTIEIDGTANFNTTLVGNCFYDCRSLANIIGTITGIKVNIDFHWSPLTRASALVVLNGLTQVQASQKVTFSYSTYNLLTDADIAIATSKNWQVETIIEWEDNNLRDYILAQFPNNVGLTYSGQITNLELASITNLNGAFYQKEYFDDNQTKPFYTFNEFRFFTGLTALNQISANSGEFTSCTKLESIVMPKLTFSNNVADIRSLFRYCVSLQTLDLTPIRAGKYFIYFLAYYCTGLEEVTLPSGTYGQGTSGQNFARYAFMECRNMTTLNIDGIADFSGISTFYADMNNNGMFTGCTSLATITGTITGIKVNISFNVSPLDHDTALMLLNGLATVAEQQTITFSASTYATLTAEEIAIATNKNWQVASA